MHTLSLVAGLSVLFQFTFSSPVQPVQCTVAEHSVGANSTHCLTAFEQLKASITAGNFGDQHRSCVVSVVQPARKSFDPTVLQYAFNQLIEACPYGSYALDAAATLNVAPVEDRMSPSGTENMKRSLGLVRIREIARRGGNLAWYVYQAGCNTRSPPRPFFTADDSRDASLGFGVDAMCMANLPGSVTDILPTSAFLDLNGGTWRLFATFELVGVRDWATVIRDPRFQSVFNAPAIATFTRASVGNFLEGINAPSATYLLRDAVTGEDLVNLGLLIVQLS